MSLDFSLPTLMCQMDPLDELQKDVSRTFARENRKAREKSWYRISTRVRGSELADYGFTRFRPQTHNRVRVARNSYMFVYLVQTSSFSRENMSHETFISWRYAFIPVSLFTPDVYDGMSIRQRGKRRRIYVDLQDGLVFMDFIARVYRRDSLADFPVSKLEIVHELLSALHPEEMFAVESLYQ